MADPVLEAGAVSFEAGGRPVLSGVSLALCKGRVTCMMGPNGGGKTTLLTIMALLRSPGAGEIRFEGQLVDTGSLGVRRRFGVVLKGANLFRTTVRENVMEGLIARGAPRSSARVTTMAWLDRLKIAHLAGRSARALSSGESARVAFARALAIDPRVLFLDEPFSSLDPSFRGEFIGELGALIRGGEIATLLVTHDPVEARALADEVAALEDGRLTRCGIPDELLTAR